ncbi:N-acetylmuramoyl-L-alanine amidase [Bartonella sp. TP]|uniref:N-acetylmuramoyl-L-alanine amidase family protein n=1 Tax=Bartonella sp. TP TaxID=3057550 RepID=UPI0025B1E142|nr:N-acetylmuramoyl-L-alanine amidase [Bartonella sp. TP]WJW79954.1 N-acetylmuramoyl-L-alanine amidase [Bartonella sp. TP]
MLYSYAAQNRALISLYANITTQNSTKIVAVFNFKPKYQLKLDQVNNKKIIFQCSRLDKALNIQAGGIVNNITRNENTDYTEFTLSLNELVKIRNTKMQELAPGLWQVSFDLAISNAKSPYLQNITQKNIVKTILGSTKPEKAKIFTVILDPGHGGIDSGAVAADGMMEKKLTLQFAKILQNVLSSNPKIKVLLTRTTDTYLYLSERVQKARELKADLFISIHADIINSPAIRGATIYRLSEIGSDKLAQQLAISQNKVDELGSLTLPETPKVENILLDLTKKETDNFRSAIVSMMVNALKQQHIRLINHPDRSANFYVLKALEFPSILVELGYLSNKSDEYLIRDGKWQMKMAHAMANAIEKFRKYRLANSSNQR